MEKVGGMIALVVAALTASAVETVSFPKLNAPGLIDGELTEACWQKAYRAAPFTSAKAGGKLTEATEAYAFYDDTTLYIGFKCEFASYAQREEEIKSAKWATNGDDVEVFVDPGETGDAAQFIVNVAGITYKSGFCGPVQCAVQLHEKDWSAEIAIPFDSIKISPKAKNGSAWRVNFARGNSGLKEYSSWSKLENGYFQDNPAFNRVTGLPADLEAIAAAQARAACPDFAAKLDRTIYTDQTEAKATLDLVREQSLKGCTLRVSVKGGGGCEVKEVGLHNEVSLPIASLTNGQYAVDLELVEADGKVGRSACVEFWKRPAIRSSSAHDRYEIKGNYIYKNGEFFFPVITTSNWPHKAYPTRAEWEASVDGHMRDLAEHGVNVLISRGKNTTEESPEDLARCKGIAAWDLKTFENGHQLGVTLADYCAIAARHGMAIIYQSHYFNRGKTTPYQIGKFADQLVRVREIPNLLCYQTMDESDGDVEGNELKSRLYHEIDPTRFTWLNIINAVQRNANAGDVLSTDPYPIPNGKITAVSGHADRLMKWAKEDGRRAAWLWLQDFGGEGSWTRPPTPQEVKAMTMLAVNHGVAGVAHFMWVPEKERNGVRQHPDNWPMFKAFNPFVQKWAEPLLLGKLVFLGRQGDLDVRAVEYEGRKILSVVNVEDKPVSATVKIDGFGDKAFALEGYGISVKEL